MLQHLLNQCSLLLPNQLILIRKKMWCQKIILLVKKTKGWISYFIFTTNSSYRAEAPMQLQILPQKSQLQVQLLPTSEDGIFSQSHYPSITSDHFFCFFALRAKLVARSSFGVDSSIVGETGADWDVFYSPCICSQGIARSSQSGVWYKRNVYKKSEQLIHNSSKY